MDVNMVLIRISLLHKSFGVFNRGGPTISDLGGFLRESSGSEVLSTISSMHLGEQLDTLFSF